MTVDDDGCAWEKIRSLLVAGQCHTHDVTVRLNLGHAFPSRGPSFTEFLDAVVCIRML
jgi:hypothetical protein